MTDAARSRELARERMALRRERLRRGQAHYGIWVQNEHALVELLALAGFLPDIMPASKEEVRDALEKYIAEHCSV